LAVIVGSGVRVEDLAVDGDDRLVDGVTVRDSGPALFMSRHGPKGTVPAHLVDHPSNARALVELGCTRVVALASTGSLRTDWPVGTVVAPDDFFAPWAGASIFDDTRGHTVPGFDGPWRAAILRAWRAAAASPIVDGGVYVHTTGPRFETPAEIRFFATVGDLVGMTLASECVVAKELGLTYAAVCIVDNMANGLDDVLLTQEDFDSGVAANRHQFLQDVRRVVRQMVEDEGWA
jgi:5'-methylthioadenosine phosphorylase